MIERKKVGIAGGDATHIHKANTLVLHGLTGYARQAALQLLQSASEYRFQSRTLPDGRLVRVEDGALSVDVADAETIRRWDQMMNTLDRTIREAGGPRNEFERGRMKITCERNTARQRGPIRRRGRSRAQRVGGPRASDPDDSEPAHFGGSPRAALTAALQKFSRPRPCNGGGPPSFLLTAAGRYTQAVAYA